MQADSTKGHEKLFIIGKESVGKSALISHLLGRNIKPTKDVQITLFQREQKWHAGIIRDYYLVKLGLKNSDFLQSLSESDDKVCYVFNAFDYDFSKIAKDLESIVNLAKAKGLKLRVLGTFGSFLDRAKKDSILQEIKTNLESILGKNTCEIYEDSKENAPYSFKDKNTKLAIFDLKDTNATLLKENHKNDTSLKEKLLNFLNFGPPPHPYNTID